MARNFEPMNAFPQPVATLLHVKTQFEGFHRWPEAPDDVAFLRNLHRHLFSVVLTLSLPPNSTRQFEFFQVQRDLKLLCRHVLIRLKEVPSMSCEQIAACIGNCPLCTWRPFLLSITVSEDEENSATVVFGKSAHENTPAVHPGQPDQPAS